MGIWILDEAFVLLTRERNSTIFADGTQRREIDPHEILSLADRGSRGEDARGNDRPGACGDPDVVCSDQVDQPGNEVLVCVVIKSN